MKCVVADCPTAAICRGWCQKHYVRWRRTGDPLVLRRPYRQPPSSTVRPKRDRWDERVDRTGECWIWTGATNSHGYGQLRTGRIEMAHRLAWEFYRGPIPARTDVLHRCDKPPCVNPDHLWLGTAQDNARDMMLKGRWGGIKPPRSKGGYGWKLDSSKVAEIRARAADGETFASIARRMSLTPQTISSIVRRRSWRRVL